MKDKKLRIEDALAATKAAVEEGIVAGGGVALVDAIPAVEAFSDTLEGDEKTGAKIVVRVLEEPMRQIAANALSLSTRFVPTRESTMALTPRRRSMST